ncbi:hypothetical protein N9N67_02335 [Bacteriovoracaceae bacterium]|nr:hypothetical protein [Bacteriovoracaceae bacterium]
MWKEIKVEKEINRIFDNLIQAETVFNLLDSNTHQVVPVVIKVLNLNSKEIILRPLHENDIFLFEDGSKFEFTNLRENIVFTTKARRIRSKLIYALCPRLTKLNEFRKNPRFSLVDRNDQLKVQNQSLISYQSGHKQYFEAQVIDLSETGMRLGISLLDNEKNKSLILPKSKIKLISLNGNEFAREILGRIVYYKKDEKKSEGNRSFYLLGIEAEGNHHFMEAILGNPLV